MKQAGTIFAIVGGLLAGLLGGYILWGQTGSSDDAPKQAEASREASTGPTIAPSDFAVLPCGLAIERGGCVIIAAGGKRVLVDAPSGVSNGQDAALLGPTGIPDAILLFALDAARIEGLDELRNRVWEAGITTAVPLVGGEGIEEIGAGLDQTYIVPDAVAYISGTRQGGFDSTPLATRAVRPGEVAFDTGDLKISALAGGTGLLAYRVEYAGQSLILADCGANSKTIKAWSAAEHFVGCDGAAELMSARRSGDWPLRTAVLIP